MPLYSVDKPLGLTSHDVVARARRLLGTRRVGHAGTLDPLATGVLLLMSQEATKLSQFLTGHDKSYLAWVTFGTGTPTLDAEGPVSATADASHIGSADVEAVLPRFLALTEQRPPAYSAIKQAGERSYTAARRGEAEEPPARPVGYRSIELLALASDFQELPRQFAPLTDAGAGAGAGAAVPAGEVQLPAGAWRPAAGGRTFELPERLPRHPSETGPTALISLRVAAGTYVRSFARDLGQALAVPAHLAGLVRTSSGRLDLSKAVPLDGLETATPVDPRVALEAPEITVDAPTALALVRGQRPPLAVAERTTVWDEGGALIAVLDPDTERAYRVVRVFSRGE